MYFPVPTPTGADMQRTTTILLVDDDVRHCQSVEALLDMNGYQSITANSGTQATDVFEKGAPDLALLDVSMPDADGFDLLKQFKKQRPDLPIIMLTGNASIDAAVDALRKGAYDYLLKPFEHGKLLKTIQNALEQQRLRSQNVTITRELAQSQERYRYLVQNSPDIIYMLDESGNFSFISDSVSRLLGFQPAEVIGNHYTNLVAQRDWSKAQYTFNERRTGERATSGVELRLVVKKHDKPRSNGNGHYRPIELKSTGLYGQEQSKDNNYFIGTYGVGRDISERKKLENQLQHAQRQEAMGRLAGGIAHDFNNLLMGIQGRASLLSLELGKSHPQREHIEAIEEYVRSAANLTRQLLGFARGGKYEVKPVDIDELLLSSAAMFGRTRKDIQIHTQTPFDRLVVEVDKRQIEQVLLNVFINSWQAMPNGGDLYLETSVVSFDDSSFRPPELKKGQYAKISITDTGIGMDDSIRQRVFDPFFTTKEKGRGTGLGLASAYGIIKNHGGMITVYSEMGHGATFNIYLPLSNKDLQSESLDRGKLFPGNETVLLVDDEAMVIDVGKAMLEKLGYRVVAVTGGEAAVEQVKRGGAIDIVVLDLIMPGMDGGKTFETLREIDPDIPVMLSSGYAMNGMAENVMRRGCNGFIQKPFNIAELSQKIRTILDGTPPV
jgi:two-component system cell cycle sensor histidine kinase/response regulator CckA